MSEDKYTVPCSLCGKQMECIFVDEPELPQPFPICYCARCDLLPLDTKKEA